MATAVLIETRLAYRLFYRLLEYRFRPMMAVFSPCAWIERSFGGWENILPLPGRSGVWVFACKSVEQIDLTIACDQVFFMDQFCSGKLSLHRLL